jgi:hypothetical protein
MNTNRTPIIKRLVRRAIAIWKETDDAQRRLFEFRTGIKP